MSKITFRADADLVDRLEELEGSKSEVMREALRDYLNDEARSDTAASDDAAGADSHADDTTDGDAVDSLDDALAARVDELVADRLEEVFGSSAAAAAAHAGGSRPFGVPGGAGSAAPEVNLTVHVDGAGATVGSGGSATHGEPTEADRTVSDGTGKAPASDASVTDESASDTGLQRCAQCGDDVSDDHVFCPNCGEKATQRLFCECGDEVRSDWAFCPGCGRRTPAADVLDAK